MQRPPHREGVRRRDLRGPRQAGRGGVRLQPRYGPYWRAGKKSKLGLIPGKGYNVLNLKFADTGERGLNNTNVFC